ncbi:hypothetical protein J5288_08725 [Agrobacterium sp. S2/73]|uniref:hypothetical protein n=1 Tax=unclassified Agrobacterium TaxID=2632611 RepID=UPI001ADB6101|nr:MULTISPECIES: hypothetical protein [unclassified Agrobacterium]MBO9108786.1 hypothetical protein [Agrobacterium sp. S2/73]QXZ73457.1 hypothetical protein J5276_05785 [Agrobacterium sp. S7/73]
MADRPILFSAPMIRALLAGTKTQTRRLIKPQPPAHTTCAGFFSTGSFGWMAGDPADLESWEFLGDFKTPISGGDRLWVRETWSGLHQFRNTPPALRESFSTPDGVVIREDVWLWADGSPSVGDWEKPRPGIHMPRWASRLTLTVTDVRVERLQDISEDDAVAEGADIAEGHRSQITGGPMVKVGPGTYMSPIAWYHRLWNEINGTGAWETNPWVVAYTFTVHHGNIDQIAQVAA